MVLSAQNKPDKIRRTCNAKAPQIETSLNDRLLAGPDLLGNVIGILLRFRQVAIAIQGDIEAIFMQIGVRQQGDVICDSCGDNQIAQN